MAGTELVIIPHTFAMGTFWADEHSNMHLVLRPLVYTEQSQSTFSGGKITEIYHKHSQRYLNSRMMSYHKC